MSSLYTTNVLLVFLEGKIILEVVTVLPQDVGVGFKQALGQRH